MAADYSGTRPQPGFWVWNREYRELFWFYDDRSPAFWKSSWDSVHGPGVYVPLIDDYFTPELFP